jgi:starch phosphorylase
VWKLDVGRVPLILLDTDIPENELSDRPITHTLYVRGREMRFCQEMILGIGGVRALEALAIEPSAWHVNEGHAAMAFLERIRRHRADGADIATVEQSIREKSLFTLHTPVPAGNEVFDVGIAARYLDPLRRKMEMSESELAELGSSNGDHSQFDLGALAIRMSTVVNGVSKTHAEVATRDWQHLIGGAAAAVTNGVHTPTWIGRDGGRLLSSFFGRNWPTVLLEDPEAIEQITQLPLPDVWAVHQARKEIFVTFARGRLRRQLARHGASPEELRQVDAFLRPTASLSVLPVGLRPISERLSCSRTWAALRHWLPTRIDPCRSSSPERPIRPTATARTSSSASSNCRARPGSRATFSCWRTTTPELPASWSRASTSG